jgi:hypothetical protein
MAKSLTAVGDCKTPPARPQLLLGRYLAAVRTGGIGHARTRFEERAKPVVTAGMALVRDADAWRQSLTQHRAS